MKVKILKSTVASKKPVKAGDIVDLEKSEALFLVSIRKAEVFIEPAAEENNSPAENERKDSSAEAEEKPIKSKKGK